MAFEGDDALDEIRALVDQVQLESVEFHEVSARCFDSASDGEDGEILTEVQIRESLGGLFAWYPPQKWQSARLSSA